jgi:hypothetical protein
MSGCVVPPHPALSRAGERVLSPLATRHRPVQARYPVANPNRRNGLGPAERAGAFCPSNRASSHTARLPFLPKEPSTIQSSSVPPSPLPSPTLGGEGFTSQPRSNDGATVRAEKPLRTRKTEIDPGATASDQQNARARSAPATEHPLARLGCHPSPHRGRRPG